MYQALIKNTPKDKNRFYIYYKIILDIKLSRKSDEIENTYDNMVPLKFNKYNYWPSLTVTRKIAILYYGVLNIY